MRMLIGLVSALVLSMPALAANPNVVQNLIYKLVQQEQIQTVAPKMLNWHVGDHAEYSLNMGFLSGTMNMKITQKVSQGFWLEQDLNLSMMGQHQIKELIDQSGKVIKMTVDGKSQTPPANDPEQIIQEKREQITVKAGTFQVIYLQIRDNKTKQTSQVWVNPQLIPIAGMAKSIQPSQMGQATLELTSFGFANK